MDKKLYNALRNKALGYDIEEKTEEHNAEGDLIKTKTVKKKVLPDLAAIKMLLELDSEKNESMTLEELEKEKRRLIKELIVFEKKTKKNLIGQTSLFD
ncbi:MAG: hypothetical protein FWC11_03130 [Firmicutes bacterium]|nr:hypothetical protein [Bacillota bacterium]